jgi:DivIVA domain-containing protein
MVLTSPTAFTDKLTSEEIATHDFSIVRRGFDPDQVRSFLGEMAAQHDPFTSLGAQVAGVLETAHRSADSYAEATRAQADAYAATRKAEADALAERQRAELDAQIEQMRSESEMAKAAVLADAASDAARARAEAAQLLADTEAACVQLREEVEAEVRTAAVGVLEEHQRRLDRARIAECEVRDRLRAALKMVDMDDQLPDLLHSGSGLLDDAFEAFVSDDIEPEPSREWILND